MRHRPIMRFLPCLDRLEEKQLLSASALTPSALNLKAGSAALAHQAAEPKPPTGFLAFRVTQKPYTLVPPFQQVLVQSSQPVPGQVYNVLSIAVKNGTAQTFDASSGFTVRLPGGRSLPILTGTEQWKPQQVIVFYVLTKKYYPLAQVPGGFQLDLGGRSSTLVPGPSGIFLRLTYNPPTFARTLDWIVAFGPGRREAGARNLACLTRPSTSSSPQEPGGSILAGISSRPADRPFIQRARREQCSQWSSISRNPGDRH